ncbi:MAG: tRNA methyl transferase PRC-barrel domain-containing protein, partial [Candidatus Gracilibacteria bacterium]
VKRFGASGVATGHYARITKRGGEYQLGMAHDKEKDQSYFLHQLDQKQLAQVILPLGDLKKEEVYRIAKKFGFNKIAGKKESQGICFFPEATPENFLKRNLKAGLFVGGPIVTLDGRKIGLHKGLPLYTIGQRQGLGIGGVKGEPDGEPWYVIKIDRKNNSLIVGRKKDTLQNKISVYDLRFVSGKMPKNKKINVDVKIRHRALPVKGVLELHGKKGTVITKKPLSAVTPGQFAVCYVREKVLCGGIIK